MPRSANQKLKLLCLCRILWERTDEDHPLTVPELIQALEAWDIKAERKSIYDDMEALRTLGMDVQSRKGKSPSSSPSARAASSSASWSPRRRCTRPASSSGRCMWTAG